MTKIYGSVLGLALALIANISKADTVVGVDPSDLDGLVIRDGPSSKFDAIGHIPADAAGVVRHACRATGRTTWCQVTYRSHKGWVNARYLSADGPSAAKPSLQEPRPSAPSSEQPQERQQGGDQNTLDKSAALARRLSSVLQRIEAACRSGEKRDVKDLATDAMTQTDNYIIELITSMGHFEEPQPDMTDTTTTSAEIYDNKIHVVIKNVFERKSRYDRAEFKYDLSADIDMLRSATATTQGVNMNCFESGCVHSHRTAEFYQGAGKSEQTRPSTLFILVPSSYAAKGTAAMYPSSQLAGSSMKRLAVVALSVFACGSAAQAEDRVSVAMLMQRMKQAPNGSLQKIGYGPCGAVCYDVNPARQQQCSKYSRPFYDTRGNCSCYPDHACE